eukprot:scaffold41767_cov21-Tisochrysis_lutea.AAC.1
MSQDELLALLAAFNSAGIHFPWSGLRNAYLVMLVCLPMQAQPGCAGCSPASAKPAHTCPEFVQLIA